MKQLQLKPFVKDISKVNVLRMLLGEALVSLTGALLPGLDVELSCKDWPSRRFT